jgi:hypothetical protein
MKKLIVLLVIAVAACATTRVPAPSTAPAVSEPGASHAEPAAAVPQEKKIAAAEPAAPAPESVKPALQPAAQQPAVAVKKEQETAPVPEDRQPEKQQTSPLVAAKQPEPAIMEQRKSSVPETREQAVPDHQRQSLADLAADNDERLMSVFVGMYRKTVETIMGDHNPFRRRTITGTDGQTYDVVFYLTREPRKGKAITDRMLTPIIFKKGRVVALGNYQLKKLIRTGTLERPKVVGARH